jgi:hypothetical protein
MAKLSGPMRAFKVELLRGLSDPAELRNGGRGVVPVDFESGTLRVSSDSGVGLLEHLGKVCYAFPVSGQSCRGRLMRPVIHAERCIAGVVEVQRVHVFAVGKKC